MSENRDCAYLFVLYNEDSRRPFVKQATFSSSSNVSFQEAFEMWSIKIQRGIRNVKRKRPFRPTEKILSLSLSLSLYTMLKVSARDRRAASNRREGEPSSRTSARLFHLQGLSWTTGRCPSSFVVPLWLVVSDSPSNLVQRTAISPSSLLAFVVPRFTRVARLIATR